MQLNRPKEESSSRILKSAKGKKCVVVLWGSGGTIQCRGLVCLPPPLTPEPSHSIFNTLRAACKLSLACVSCEIFFILKKSYQGRYRAKVGDVNDRLIQYNIRIDELAQNGLFMQIQKRYKFLPRKAKTKKIGYINSYSYIIICITKMLFETWIWNQYK